MEKMLKYRQHNSNTIPRKILCQYTQCRENASSVFVQYLLHFQRYIAYVIILKEKDEL